MSVVWKRFIDSEAGAILDISSVGDIRTIERTISFSDNKPPRTYKPLILKQQKDKCGYMRVRVSGEYRKVNYKVHRLVAISHIELPLNKQPKDLQVNHKDGNKSNNCVENLEWCTNGENQIHAIRLGLKKVEYGLNALRSEYTNFAIDKITGEITDIIVGNAQMTERGYDPRLVHRIIRGDGKRKHHKGKIFTRIAFVFEDY